MSTNDGNPIDPISGTETTGHEWDGIRELNTPLPRWWAWIFYATIIWGVGYMIAYPAIPLVNSATKGLLGYSSRANLDRDMAAAREAQAENYQKIADLALEAIRDDENLVRFASAGGRSAYLVNCVQCHGSGAAGSEGYPNLNDDDWIWGGALDDIYLTLRHGVRYDLDDETRISDMPAFGIDEILEPAEIAQVTEYVLKIADLEHDAAMAAAGADIYDEQCAACHGAEGEGIRELGGPALNDAIWLYGGTRELIAAQIHKPRQGVMPGWKDRLDDTTIKQLTVYVHGLGGGE